MFGVKVKNLKTANTYTLESFFDAIKDKEFSAGKPELVKHGPATIIAFPALDSQNQVQIINGGFKKESQKWMIQKAQQAGLANVAANAAIDHLSGGLFGFKQIVGSTAKQCEQLVEATYTELSGMNL